MILSIILIILGICAGLVTWSCLKISSRESREEEKRGINENNYKPNTTDK